MSQQSCIFFQILTPHITSGS